MEPGAAPGSWRRSRPGAWLHDERARSLLVQLAVLAVALVLVAYLVSSVFQEMASRGLAPGVGFLSNVAGFGIGEGLRFSEQDTYWRAFFVGFVNSLRVAVAGIVLATGLGFAVAVGRVSGNILASAIAVVYVEVLRNTPLLVQLIFWFRAVVLPLPAIAQSGEVFGADVGGRRQAVFFWSQRGTALAWPRPGAPGWAFVLAVAGMCVAAWLVWRWRRRVEERSGVAARSVLWSGATAALVLGIGWWLWPAQPLVLEWPAVGRFRYEGGLQLTPEFTALLLGLVTYTAAYIAEVFRSGLNAVSRGQREAAQALGLRDPQVLRFVVLPQALRVVIPPLTSQYLNLIKNSSLAIYIGYPDLFNVSLTIGNQTGQFVVLTGMVMVVYLAWSLLTSLIMNVIFRRVQVVER